jgi:putative two-component system response regulator
MSDSFDIAESCVVVVDDEPTNLTLLERLLKRHGVGEVVTTEKAMHAVAICRADPPDLLLLDLHMPDLDGLGVLAQLRDIREGDGHFPVLVLTGDGSAGARRGALGAGADDFLAKPFDAIEAGLRVEHLLRAHVMRRLLSDEQRILRVLVAEQIQEIELTRAEILDRLAVASEFRDDETQQHARRIGRSARLVGERLGCAEPWIEVLERAASLHDIGKLGIPDAILLKPGTLTADEFDAMKEHTTIGAQILGGSRTALLQLAEEIALTHHERWDGAGYPTGLVGAEAPLAGRIVAVADVFDALIHKRSYKPAWTTDDARRWIADHAGSQFDPAVAAAFGDVPDAELLAPVG